MTAHQSRTSRAIAILIRYPQSLCYLYVRDVLPDYDILPPGGTSRKYLAWAMVPNLVQFWCVCVTNSVTLTQGRHNPWLPSSDAQARMARPATAPKCDAKTLKNQRTR